MSNDSPHAGCASEDTQFYKRLLDRLNDGVYFVDHERRITYWNEGAAKLTGFAAEEAMGRYCHDDFLCHVDRSGERLCTNKCPLSTTITDGQSREAFVFLRHKDGHRVPVHVRVAPIYEHSRVIGAVEIFNDNSDRESVQCRAEHLQKLAFLDPLTQVANRRYLEIRLQSAIQEFALSVDPFGLLIIDVDKFKAINDQHGHDVGDGALTIVARTLKGILRPDDVVGRWGGDEFVAIVNHANLQTLTLVGERCRLLVSQARIARPSGALSVTLSVGGAVAQTDDTADSLLQRADRMMCASKAKGRNSTSVE